MSLGKGHHHGGGGRWRGGPYPFPLDYGYGDDRVIVVVAESADEDSDNDALSLSGLGVTPAEKQAAWIKQQAAIAKRKADQIAAQATRRQNQADAAAARGVKQAQAAQTRQAAYVANQAVRQAAQQTRQDAAAARKDLAAQKKQDRLDARKPLPKPADTTSAQPPPTATPDPNAGPQFPQPSPQPIQTDIQYPYPPMYPQYPQYPMIPPQPNYGAQTPPAPQYVGSGGSGAPSYAPPAGGAPPDMSQAGPNAGAQFPDLGADSGTDFSSDVDPYGDSSAMLTDDEYPDDDALSMSGLSGLSFMGATNVTAQITRLQKQLTRLVGLPSTNARAKQIANLQARIIKLGGSPIPAPTPIAQPPTLQNPPGTYYTDPSSLDPNAVDNLYVDAPIGDGVTPPMPVAIGQPVPQVPAWYPTATPDQNILLAMQNSQGDSKRCLAVRKRLTNAYNRAAKAKNPRAWDRFVKTQSVNIMKQVQKQCMMNSMFPPGPGQTPTPPSGYGTPTFNAQTGMWCATRQVYTGDARFETYSVCYNPQTGQWSNYGGGGQSPYSQPTVPPPAGTIAFFDQNSQTWLANSRGTTMSTLMVTDITYQWQPQYGQWVQYGSVTNSTTPPPVPPPQGTPYYDTASGTWIAQVPGSTTYYQWIPSQGIWQLVNTQGGQPGYGYMPSAYASRIPYGADAGGPTIYEDGVGSGTDAGLPTEVVDDNAGYGADYGIAVEGTPDAGGGIVSSQPLTPDGIEYSGAVIGPMRGRGDYESLPASQFDIIDTDGEGADNWNEGASEISIDSEDSQYADYNSSSFNGMGYVGSGFRRMSGYVRGAGRR